MRTSILLLGILLAVSASARGQDDRRCWTPDAQQIASLEEKIATRPMPLGSLDRYARYYAGVVARDLRFIRGKLVPLDGNQAPGIHFVDVVEGERRIIRGVLVRGFHEKPGIYVESEARLPAIADGGCWVINVKFDPSNKQLDSRCNSRR